MSQALKPSLILFTIQLDVMPTYPQTTFSASLLQFLRYSSWNVTQRQRLRLRYLSTESHAQQRLLNGYELQFQRLISPGFHSQTKLKVLSLPCQSFLSFYEQKKAVLPYFTIPRREAVQREHAQISLQVSFRF